MFTNVDVHEPKVSVNFRCAMWLFHSIQILWPHYDMPVKEDTVKSMQHFLLPSCKWIPSPSWFIVCDNLRVRKTVGIIANHGLASKLEPETLVWSWFVIMAWCPTVSGNHSLPDLNVTEHHKVEKRTNTCYRWRRVQVIRKSWWFGLY